MGLCISVEKNDIELDEFTPLPMIDLLKFKKIRKFNEYKFNDYKFKNRIYWIYLNENHFKNRLWCSVHSFIKLKMWTVRLLVVNEGLLKVTLVVLFIAGFNTNTDVVAEPKLHPFDVAPVTPACPIEHIVNEADVAPIDAETQFQRLISSNVPAFISGFVVRGM